MAATLRVGSVGVDIIVPLTDTGGNPIDLSLATVITLYLRPPGTSSVASPKVATKLGSGKDGKLIYTTVVGDLTVDGDWLAQSRVQYSNPTRDWWSEIYPVIVAKNLA